MPLRRQRRRAQLANDLLRDHDRGDIFDALTESDRQHKRAVTPAKALDILQSEAKEGLLDQDLVQILIESQVYQKTLERDRRHGSRRANYVRGAGETWLMRRASPLEDIDSHCQPTATLTAC